MSVSTGFGRVRALAPDAVPRVTTGDLGLECGRKELLSFVLLKLHVLHVLMLRVGITTSPHSRDKGFYRI